jgi:hypothetical protein
MVEPLHFPHCSSFSGERRKGRSSTLSCAIQKMRLASSQKATRLRRREYPARSEFDLGGHAASAGLPPPACLVHFGRKCVFLLVLPPKDDGGKR